MKKLLFILSAVLVSGMIYGDNDGDDPYTLNPYAYDLRASWDDATQSLNIHFKVNSIPNFNKTNGDQTGIQVIAKSKVTGIEYPIWLPSESVIKGKHSKWRGGTYDYAVQLLEAKDARGNTMPRGEEMTWKVVVNGRKSASTSLNDGLGNKISYDYPRYWNASDHDFGNQRYIAHSIAINRNPMAPNFGHIIIADGLKVNGDNTTTWGSLHTSTYDSYNKGGRGVYILGPDFTTPDNQVIRASLNNNNVKGGFVDPLEPRDVCVTESGRVFVCSYSNNGSTSNSVAVWELTNNYTTWTPVLYKSDISSYPRVIAMDAKENGAIVTLLLLCSPQGDVINSSVNVTTVSGNKLKYYELTLSNNGKTLSNAKAVPAGVSGYNYYVNGINAHAKIAYGANGVIWFGLGNGSGSRVVSIDASGNQKDVEDFGKSLGGEGFLVHNDLLVKSFRNTNTNGLNAGVCFKKITNNHTVGGTYYPDAGYDVFENKPIGSGHWINDFALDYANNLYFATSYYARVCPIPLPYSGQVGTPAKEEFNFTIPHFASDLTYAPVEGKNQYKFTFNVDATPRTVDVRFYTTKEQMLKGGNDYAFHYSAFKTVAKSPMSVTFDAVKGTITNKELNDPDGNGVLNLPPGEYYWAVCVTREDGQIDVTPSSDKYCYIPERLSHDMVDTEMNPALGTTPKGLDLYRPFQGGMFNTICLPFTLDLNGLPDNHPLKDATLKEYKGLQLQGGVGEEKVLELIFADVDGGIIRANTPYLIQPKENYNSIIRFATPFELTSTTGGTVYHEDETNTYGISYQGIIPLSPTVVDGESLTLILVADNRLAVLTGAGDMYGFRGYFQLHQPLPRGMQTRITTSKGTTTNTTIVVDGKKVNVNKFLREGRVYIRMGDSLYTVDGQVVE